MADMCFCIQRATYGRMVDFLLVCWWCPIDLLLREYLSTPSWTASHSQVASQIQLLQNKKVVVWYLKHSPLSHLCLGHLGCKLQRIAQNAFHSSYLIPTTSRNSYQQIPFPLPPYPHLK
jgi:hypothetical protein